MSKMTVKNDKFISEVSAVLWRFNLSNGIVYYDGSPYSKRDYVINATVGDWGSIDTYYLKKALRDAGLQIL